MAKEYFKIGEIVFGDGDYPMPSQIIPSVELIKNTERSIGGRMQLDIIANKENVQVIFDMLNEYEFNAVMDVFNIQQQHHNGLQVSYTDIYTQKNVQRNMCVINTSFDPLILENEIKWRNVVIELAEI